MLAIRDIQEHTIATPIPCLRAPVHAQDRARTQIKRIPRIIHELHPHWRVRLALYEWNVAVETYCAIQRRLLAVAMLFEVRREAQYFAVGPAFELINDERACNYLAALPRVCRGVEKPRTSGRSGETLHRLVSAHAQGLACGRRKLYLGLPQVFNARSARKVAVEHERSRIRLDRVTTAVAFSVFELLSSPAI